MSLGLMEHQKVALAFMDMCDDGLLIAYDIGCGKTMIAIEWIRRSLNRKAISNALIICPAALVGQWKQAIDDCVKFGYLPEEIEMIKKAVTITSYQKTYRSEKHVLHFKDGSDYVQKKVSIRDEIDKEWDVVFCDESHNLGGHSSVQTKVCVKLATHAGKRFALSGTPLHGGGGKQDWSKMYGQVQFITGGKRWKTWTGFCKDCVHDYDKWFKPKTWNDKRCESIFKDYAISCRREDCMDLPGQTEINLYCGLSERKIYNDIKKGKLDEYNITSETAGTQYRKMLQIVSGSCITNDGTLTLSSSKDDMLENIINGTDEKIIIFCQYRASLDRCFGLCSKNGRNPVRFDGESKGETWREFQEGDKDTLVVQYDAGAAGLNLQSAHICVFYEPTMSALKLEQAAGRIYRKGQSKGCIYYYLVTSDTLEEKVWSTVRSGVTINNDMLISLAKGTL